MTAPLAGTYTAVVSDGTSRGDAMGSYLLHLAKTPGAFVVPEGDEGQALTNGAIHPGKIHLGDVDPWSFEAAQGDYVVASIGEYFESEIDPGFRPSIQLLGPDGKSLAQASGALAARVSITAAVTGTYTLVITDGTSNVSGTGSYVLTLARAPGESVVSEWDEGGPVSNGGNHLGKIHIGDIDAWTFDATRGDQLVVSAGEVFQSEVEGGLRLFMALFGPDGKEVAQSSGALAARVTASAPLTGRYAILLYDGSSDRAGTGDYVLRLARAPGAFVVSDNAEGGPWTNGASHPGVLDVGDLDLWSFDALQGELIKLNVAEVLTGKVDPGLRPSMSLLGPDGAPAGSAAGASNAEIAITAGRSGLYTVLIYGSDNGSIPGAYHLRFSRIAPDLEGPVLTHIDESTPLSLVVSAVDPETPEKELQFELLSGPPGASLTVQSATNAVISWPTSENEGATTNVFVGRVTDGVGAVTYRRTNTFTVVVDEINLPPEITVPEDQQLDELTSLQESVSATDSDVPPNPVTFRLAAAPEGMVIDPNSGAITWRPSEAQGPSSNVIEVVVTDENPLATNDHRLSATNSFVVMVREANLPPVLKPIADQQTADNSVFSLQLHASDPDDPANTLSFALGLGAPEGVSLDAQTGELRWPIGPLDEGVTESIPVRVTDDGDPPLSAEGILRVNIMAATLRLAAIADQALEEQGLLTVTAVVTNSPRAVAPYTFALQGSVPDGASINPTTGVFFWRPSEAQGPATNRFTIRATDSANPPHTATESFVVTVREVNQAPVLEPIPGQKVGVGGLLTLSAKASDPDEPADGLTFAAGAGAPEGMTISPLNGTIQWKPGPLYAGTTNRVTVQVKDNGVPPLESTQVFSIVVPAHAEIHLAAEPLAPDQVRLRLSGDLGRTYLIESTVDLVNWRTMNNFVSSAEETEFVQPISPEPRSRFFRAVSP